MSAITSFVTGNPMYTAVVVIVVVLGLLKYLPKFRKNKNVQDIVSKVEEAEPLIEALVPPQFSTVLGIANTVVHYVEQIMSDDAPDAKKEEAYNTITQLLKQMNISVDDNAKKMIDVAIESAVNTMNDK